jgi:murein L,D-transpeptidase YafK
LTIFVSKSRRVLEVRDGVEVVAVYPIGIGKAGLGPKQREGDMRTPVGRYRVCVKNPRSRYHLSLGLDYPNPDDARRGHEAGLISAAELEAIWAAHERAAIPPWGTALGGEIYIHGRLERQDWSAGCIRMRDPDIEALFATTAVGTPVVIED